MLYGYRCLIVYIKADDIYKEIAEHLEATFDTSNFELDRPLSKRKIERIIGLIKEELDGKTMKKFVELRAKIYIYLIDNDRENRKTADIKKCVIKRKLKFENSKYFLEATQLDNEIICLGENKIDINGPKKYHKVFIKTIN